MSFLHTLVAFIVALGILIVVHEYGHITGHKHSADPRNVMYSGGVFRPYWRCMRAQRGEDPFG